MSATAAIARNVRASLRIVCVVPFLNEEAYLPAFLASMATQRRFPDTLLLVDDGSSDRPPQIASQCMRGGDPAGSRNETGSRRPPSCAPFIGPCSMSGSRVT